ncbi:acetyltransferase (GNAT) family protein [Vibrio crassostreae]|uniref:GNAT family N-acetyltransferase n=1 Tax=Vibrio crassostreae TaxID=246167 RepID=UPI000F4885BD|nr:GNAT family N-acetyltransferase [Vibrio crassostreae]ROO72275.1 acetyltransferase (GNAT) family protein [Vibrio crassostreae]ROP10593.1 acetyltransferase (GNAT) family protein [Vibrio crassostreae]ROQ80263.1 acetyltransferase (GNAT) family protein [Vibrio crassostreae]ROR85433.1 acetyltransferase (GNAT) family protein [Vibrio crassostreae]RPE93354.1 acetyltransferase (GNAT) family protein [Vibrio crassostreae]
MAIKEENIQLQLVSNSEFEELFAFVKQGLFIHVDNVFGWDDDFQRQRLLNDYHPSWFHWVYLGKQRVGLVCFKPYDNAYHIHLLIIFPQNQGRSLGKQAMTLIHKRATEERREQVTLSSFRSNTRGISFYQALGYQIVDDSDENFVGMTLTLTNHL